MYTQKIANIFDHIQDHSRFGLENKFLENKSRRIFLRSTGLLDKFLPTNLGVSLHEKMDLQQLQNQCKYEVNTPFDQICLYLPRGKFHRWIIFAREAKMVNTTFTQSLQSKANEKKNCTFASDLT